MYLNGFSPNYKSNSTRDVASTCPFCTKFLNYFDNNFTKKVRNKKHIKVSQNFN